MDSLDEAGAKETWEALRAAIGEIQRKNASLLSFEELYRKAYHLVLHKYGNLLYGGVQEEIRLHLRESVAPKLVRHVEVSGGASSSSSSAGGESLLDKVKAAWEEHKTDMGMIRDILMYMDRNYVHSHNKDRAADKKKKSLLLPVYDLGLKLFRDEVLAQIKDRMAERMLQLVGEERRGGIIDRPLVKSTVRMLVELGSHKRGGGDKGGPMVNDVYASYFEEHFIADAEAFYQEESNRVLSANSVSDYLKKAQARIEEERRRVEAYLDPSTMSRIMSLLDECWITKHQESIVSKQDSGCNAMLTQDKHDDMERLYVLFSRVPGTLKRVQKIFSQGIVDGGTEILSDPAKVGDPVQFIEATLKLKEKYEAFVRSSFRNSKEFQISLKFGFEEFLNKGARTAQYLSVYVDDMFRKAKKIARTDREMEQRLDQVILVFRYLRDKDVFEMYYKQGFAKRLVQNGVENDLENLFITKLKSECGHQYTCKLEGMLQDMQISEELTRDFGREKEQQQPQPEVKLTVLTTGYWPASLETAEKRTGEGKGASAAGSLPILPLQLKPAVEAFESFYSNRHQGRRLAWNYGYGHVDLRARFGSGGGGAAGSRRHELSVSTYQAFILLLFNEHEQLSYGEILRRTQLPEPELKRHLLSLHVNPKTPVLTLLGKGGEPLAASSSAAAQPPQGEESVFYAVNEQFSNRMVRVKVRLVADSSAKSSALEEETQERSRRTAEEDVVDMPASIEEDRKHLTESVIVRVMKSRKTLDHTALVIEVTKLLRLRFTPEVQLIKQRIEKLIERDFLERDPDDRKLYRYLA